MGNPKAVSPSDAVDLKTRPPVCIGHVTLTVSNVPAAFDYYRGLGLRPVVKREELAILELRGGTHLLLFRAEGKPEPGPVGWFDFMVDDIESFHASLEKAGVKVTSIGEDTIAGHLWFEVTDPDGHVVRVFSSHTEGRPV